MISLKKHYSNVFELGCCLTGNAFPELHHVIGGSLKDMGFYRGMGLRGVNEYWVIPLCNVLHREFHNRGVETWESTYAKQWDLLQEVWDRLDYEVTVEGRQQPKGDSWGF